MDANRMSIDAMKEGISKGFYELTGVLKTGEIVISLTGTLEKDLVSILDSMSNDNEKLEYTKKIMDIKGRPAHEIMQIYYQNTCSKEERNKTNGLRIR